MLKMISILSVMIFTSVSYGQNFKERWDAGNDSFRLLLGSYKLATVVGIDYERRMGATGVGAFLMQSKKRDTATTSAGTVNTDMKPEKWARLTTAEEHKNTLKEFLDSDQHMQLI
ncbi:MAG: hypothetical protein EOP06_17170, partial [Proteobacteria bacterium]